MGGVRAATPSSRLPQIIEKIPELGFFVSLLFSIPFPCGIINQRNPVSSPLLAEKIRDPSGGGAWSR
jgi:hypothetical protein